MPARHSWRRCRGPAVRSSSRQPGTRPPPSPGRPGRPPRARGRGGGRPAEALAVRTAAMRHPPRGADPPAGHAPAHPRGRARPTRRRVHAPSARGPRWAATASRSASVHAGAVGGGRRAGDGLPAGTGSSTGPGVVAGLGVDPANQADQLPRRVRPDHGGRVTDAVGHDGPPGARVRARHHLPADARPTPCDLAHPGAAERPCPGSRQPQGGTRPCAAHTVRRITARGAR